MGQPAVAADDAAVSNGCAAAKDGRVGVNHHMVADVRMPLDLLDRIAVLIQLEALGSQGDTLIQFHMVPDDRGLPYHDAGAVINKEMLADGRAGMNINPGFFMGKFRHDPGDQGHIQLIQFVRQAVDGDRVEAGIADHDLFPSAGRRIALVQGFNVQQQEPLHFRQPAGKGFHRFLRLDLRRFFRLIHKPQRRGDLPIQLLQGAGQQHAVALLGQNSAEAEGKKRRLQRLHHAHHRAAVRRRTGMSTVQRFLRGNAV